MQPNKSVEEVEKAYPEAYQLARRFHDLYEEFAPKFGYETRGDTKEFIPSSPNGRTMAYVCKTIVDEEINTVLQGVVERVEKLKEEPNDTVEENNRYWRGYNSGLDDTLSLLNDQIISNEEKK